jgi:hypothetical protein
MRAIVPGGMTIGEAVDAAISGAADHERGMIAAFLRASADDLLANNPGRPMFSASDIADLLEELAEGVEMLDHHDMNDTPSETLQ